MPKISHRRSHGCEFQDKEYALHFYDVQVDRHMNTAQRAMHQIQPLSSRIPFQDAESLYSCKKRTMQDDQVDYRLFGVSPLWKGLSFLQGYVQYTAAQWNFCMFSHTVLRARRFDEYRSVPTQLFQLFRFHQDTNIRAYNRFF